MKKLKKYENLLLIFLIIIAITLSRYQEYTINKESENKIGFMVAQDKYKVFEKGYAYVKNDNDIVVSSNVKITGYNTKVEGDLLNFYKSDELYFSYPIIRLSISNLFLIDNKIVVDDNMLYSDFVKNIVTNAEYKVFDNNNEITSGIINNKMELKIYYNGSVIDTYTILNEYLNLDDLTIRNDKYIISNVSNVRNIKEKIITNGIVKVIDKNNNILNDNDYITTNSKLIINLNNNIYNYVLVVLGDVTGSGDIFIGDISKLYNYYKNNMDMEECYVIAGDVNYDNIIDISDIEKLYRYYKGIIYGL